MSIYRLNKGGTFSSTIHMHEVFIQSVVLCHAVCGLS